MTDILKELIQYLKDISPLVWETLIKQVYANTIELAVWFVVLLIFSYLFSRVAKYGTQELQKDEWSDWEIAAPILYIFAALCIPAGIACLIGVIKYLYNPEFYAIQILLRSIANN